MEILPIILTFCCLMAVDCNPIDISVSENAVSTTQKTTTYDGSIRLLHVFVPTKKPLFPHCWQNPKWEIFARRRRSVDADGDATIQDPYKNVLMVDNINNRKLTDNKDKSPIDNFYNMNEEMVAAEDIPFPPLFQYRLKQKRRNQRKEQDW